MSDFNSSTEFEEKIRKAVQMPGANPEFVDKLRNELARRPVEMEPRFMMRPAWAIALVLILAVLIVSGPGIVAALGRLFGYVPGVGLVENPTGMRVLVEPVSVTREGVTVTVTQALVYPDHVQLIYQVSGIAPENDFATFSIIESNEADLKQFCGPASSMRDGYLSNGDAQLRLPNGMVVDRVFDNGKYPENVFAMSPAYETVVPADVSELTMLLKCIPWSRLGAVPENWEVPFQLKYVPAGTVIGQPVVDVTPSDTSSVNQNGYTVSLNNVVPQDDLYSFYFTIMPDVKKNSMLAVFPASAQIIDATGQKVWLTYNHPFPGSHDLAEPWELQSVSKPAYGPYTLTIDKIFTYYQEDGSNFFEFDTGPEPQVGQTWAIDQILHLAGTDVRVVSARMIEKDLASWGLSDNTQGIEFTFEAVDGKTPFLLDVMDRDLDRIMAGQIVPYSENGEPAANLKLALLYGNGVPAGKVAFAVNGQTVMTTGDWQLQWASPDQTGVELLTASEAVPSTQNAPGATAKLDRVVKLDDGYLFYLSMNSLEARPDLRVLAPGSVYVIDSTGKRIDLHLNGPQVNAATQANLWEFSAKEAIAEGPLKVKIENATAYYSPWDMSVPPTKELMAPYTFTFDTGSDPQFDQTWSLDQEFEIGGYKGKVTSVRAVPVDSNQLPFPEMRSDRSIDSGYEFTIQSADPTLRWNVGLSLARPEGLTGAGFVDCIGHIPSEPGPTPTHTVTCRGLANQTLEATIYEVSVQMDGPWEIDWVLPAP